MKPKIHDLKTWPGVFEDMMLGWKRFEYRYNDRDFKVGDYLNLREWLPNIKKYTGRSLFFGIVYMIQGGQFGIPEGYCIMQLTEHFIDIKGVTNGIKTTNQ